MMNRFWKALFPLKVGDRVLIVNVYRNQFSREAIIRTVYEQREAELNMYAVDVIYKEYPPNHKEHFRRRYFREEDLERVK